MKTTFSKEQIIERIKFENPWWKTGKIDPFYARMKKREYFKLFKPIVESKGVKRAVVLMGPRRVGKTVLIHQMIQNLIEQGISPKKIIYLSVETPIYNGIGLEELFRLCREALKVKSYSNFLVFFDEIQYLKEWEVHLKTLVDSYHSVKFITSGSAAAALKLKSQESGAGRFTEFILPPLTFHEYIELKGLSKLINIEDNDYSINNIEEFNKHFIDYINYGGYPEVIFSEEIRSDPGRYIRNDIIDKVLLRDLPSLYGIQDIQELNSLFTSIAYNSGDEFSLDKLSKNSGVAKNTIKKYLTYLEAAFLIKIVYRVDFNAKRFKRANFFKVYLTNPSLRSALFSPITSNDKQMGKMVETAIFSQWQHDTQFTLHYSRWKDGEVDIVKLGENIKPEWAVEIKWTNRFAENPRELNSLKKFCNANDLEKVVVTTINITDRSMIDKISYVFVPTSFYCYTVGKFILEIKSIK